MRRYLERLCDGFPKNPVVLLAGLRILEFGRKAVGLPIHGMALHAPTSKRWVSLYNGHLAWLEATVFPPDFDALGRAGEALSGLEDHSSLQRLGKTLVQFSEELGHCQ